MNHIVLIAMSLLSMSLNAGLMIAAMPRVLAFTEHYLAFLPWPVQLTVSIGTVGLCGWLLAVGIVLLSTMVLQDRGHALASAIFAVQWFVLVQLINLVAPEPSAFFDLPWLLTVLKPFPTAGYLYLVSTVFIFAAAGVSAPTAGPRKSRLPVLLGVLCMAAVSGALVFSDSLFPASEPDMMMKSSSFLDSPVREWLPDDVTSQVGSSLHFWTPEMEEKWREHELSGNALCALLPDEMNTIYNTVGVSKIGWRKDLAATIKRLCSETESWKDYLRAFWQQGVLPWIKQVGSLLFASLIAWLAGSNSSIISFLGVSLGGKPAAAKPAAAATSSSSANSTAAAKGATAVKSE